jgi:hypothetical protein
MLRPVYALVIWRGGEGGRLARGAEARSSEAALSPDPIRRIVRADEAAGILRDRTSRRESVARVDADRLDPPSKENAALLV